MKFRNTATALMFGAILLASGCKPEPKKPPGNTEQGVILDFHPIFNGQEMEFSKMKYVKPDGEVISISHWAMLMSHLSLMKSDSSLVSLGDGYQYIGFSVGRKKFTYADAPAGTYIGIKFQLGPDQNINHADPTIWPADHPMNANLNGLHWGWAGGYIFQAMDGTYKNDTTTSSVASLSFHTATDNMIQSFFMPLNFTLEPNIRKTARIEIWADEYFKNPNELHLKNGAVSHTEGSVEVALMSKIMQNAQSGVYRLVEVK